MQSISIKSLLSYNKWHWHTVYATKPWSSTCVVPLNCGLFVLVSILISLKFGDMLKKRLFFLIWVTSTMKRRPSRLCHHKEWELILFPLPQVGFPFDCLSLLLAWYYYWHGFLAFIIHFLCRNILLESVSRSEFILSCCLCKIDLRVADLALHPMLSTDSLGGWGYLFTHDRHLY